MITINRTRLAIIVAAVAILAAAAGITAWAVTTLAPQPVTAQPATFNLNGSIILQSTQIEYWSGKTGEPCTAKGGFRDLTEGAPVTVYDNAGTAVGVGKLSAGQWFSGCMWTFNVLNVPASPVIQVEVTHRGKVSFNLQDAQAGKVELTIQG